MYIELTRQFIYFPPRAVASLIRRVNELWHLAVSSPHHLVIFLVLPHCCRKTDHNSGTISAPELTANLWCPSLALWRWLDVFLMVHSTWPPLITGPNHRVYKDWTMNMGTLNNVAPLLWTQLRVRKVLLWMEDPPWVGEDEYEGGEVNLVVT